MVRVMLAAFADLCSEAVKPSGHRAAARINQELQQRNDVLGLRLGQGGRYNGIVDSEEGVFACCWAGDVVFHDVVTV